MTPQRWQIIDRLYHEALQLDPGPRDEFLAVACSDDMELRKEVESLLAHRPRAHGFLETAAGATLREPLAAALRDHAAALVPGQLIGRRLGAYELQSWVSAGGMGQVYRGIDTRLNRPVAVKIIPAHRGGDGERQRRFAFEARVISSLNHPHICTLYDVGVEDTFDYLVMEYIEGETLLQRLERGPLPLALTLEYAIQIADALDKAHRRGIAHRDLKPSNIMLSRAGVKLLDFGIAAPLSRRAEGGDSTPLCEAEMNSDVLAMGTPEFCAPEQLEGKFPDARSDLFSFGLIVYQMLTGQHPFRPRDRTALIAAVQSEEPARITGLLPPIPQALERTLARCLAKDPAERWQTASDLLFQLQGMDGSIQEKVIVSSQKPIVWFTALLAITAVMFLWFSRGTVAEPAPRRTTDIRFGIYPVPETSFASGYDIPFALAPDGRRVVYVGVRADGTQHLWLRSLSSEPDSAEPLEGTEGASTPFWSPDGQWIGFFAERALKKMRVSTGLVQVVAHGVTTLGGAAWGAGDVIIFPAAPGAMFRVSSLGGPVARVTEGEGAQLWPQFLSDGNNFVYAAGVPGEVHLASVENRRPRVLMKFPVRVSSLSYVPGYLFFVQDSALFATRFDEKSLRFTGEPVRLLEGLPVTPPGMAPFSVSASGVLAYWTYSGGTPSVLRWFDRRGNASTTVGDVAKYVGFSLSPKGDRLVFSRRGADGGADLWIRDFAKAGEQQLTFDKAAFTPQWSPDSAQIAFTGPGKNPPPKVFLKHLTLPRPDTLLGPWPLPSFASGWSPDGRFVFSVRFDGKGGLDLWVQTSDGRKQERLWLSSAASEWDARLSPDGKRLAYVTDRSGREEVWIVNYPSATIGSQASVDGGASPQWGPHGSELFYVSKGRLMAVAGGGKPRSLFNVPNIVQSGNPMMPTANSFVVSPDGNRFLIAVRARDPNAPPIRIVGDWRSLLKN
ncbi:MAG: serine/threonine-protein kinase [Acidobacteria bacterium]|nr:serine/threonine-protein kinase [Acidobacteriota bacterium]